MPRKVLFAEGGGVDALKSLHTSDKEGLGVLFEDEFGRVFRYVKNASSTGFTAAGCCLMKLGQTTPKAAFQRVLSPDVGTGPTTCLISMPAGVPVTGIGASGSSTGDHGWIQVAGPAKVSVWQSATAVDQEAGCMAAATVTSGAAWGKGYTSTIDTDTGGTVNMRGIQFAASLATTGAATAASALVIVKCLR